MDNLRKLQLTQLYILKQISKICEENGLKYYLCGGTLLGAVRHQGFIPWDDDLDITMYRKDLERLIEIVQIKHSDTMFVQTFQTDSKYTRYIPKIRLNNTVQAERGTGDDEIHHGVYVDIFPLDHVTKQGGFGLWLRGKMVRLLFAYKTTRHSKSKSATKIKLLLKKCLKGFTYLVPNKLINWMFDWVCTISDKPGAKYTTSFASHYRWKKQLVDNSVYGEGTFLKFEDAEFRVPSKYLDLLTQVFGENYMQLPPVEKRNSGHTLVKIDVGEYEAEIEKLAELCNKKEI